MNKSEKIKQWVSRLTADDMRHALVELIEFAIDAEEVSFPDLAPYWSNTGEPLVPGHVTFAEDDAPVKASFSVGDIVEPADPKYPLVSGGSRYDFAIVVQVSPLVLVSEHADMRWESTVQDREFRVIGKASDDLLARCMKRL